MQAVCCPDSCGSNDEHDKYPDHHEQWLADEDASQYNRQAVSIPSRVHGWLCELSRLSRENTKRLHHQESSVGGSALVLTHKVEVFASKSPANKNASNSRHALRSVARSYQHKALGELHRR